MWRPFSFSLLAVAVSCTFYPPVAFGYQARIPQQRNPNTSGQSNSQNPGQQQSAQQPATTAITVSGHVLNALSGQPLARALVTINGQSVLSGREGEFQFPNITGMYVSISLRKQGYVGVSTLPAGNPGLQVSVPVTTDPLDLHLYPESVISGFIAGEDGQPLEHVQVMLYHSAVRGNNGLQAWENFVSTPTNSAGEFRFAELPAGQYVVQSQTTNDPDNLRALAYLPVRYPPAGADVFASSIHLGYGEQKTIDLRPSLRHLYHITGRIEGLDGGGPGGVTIIAQTSDGLTIPFRTANLRQPGERQPGALDGTLPSGSYILTALDRRGNDLDGKQGQIQLNVADHDISGVVIQLAPLATIPVEIIADPSATTTTQTSTTVTTQPVLMPSSVQVQLIPRSFGSVAQQQQFYFSRPQQTRAAGGPGMQQNPPPPPDPNQPIVISGVPPGRYQVSVGNNGVWHVTTISYGGTDLSQQDLVVAPGAGSDPIRVVLTNETATLQGAVMIDNVPAAAYIVLLPKAATLGNQTTLRSDSTGHFSNSRIAPGDYWLLAFANQPPMLAWRDAEAMQPWIIHAQSVSIKAGETQTITVTSFASEAP